MAKVVFCRVGEVEEVLADHSKDWRLVAVVAQPIRQVFKGYDLSTTTRGRFEGTLSVEDHFDSRELYFEEIHF